MKVLLALFLALSPAASRAGGKGRVTPEMDRHLMEGVDSIWRMEFDRSEAAAKRALELQPGHPAPYLVLTGLAWTRYVYENDQSDPALLKPFYARLDEVLDASKAWLEAHPDDPEALMVAGAAYGISSRLLIVRKEWVKGYFHGRKAISYLRAAVESDPEFADAYMGIGMYDYYTDIYHRGVGVLAKIMLRGNRLRGIETLKMVAAKGRFSKNTAKIVLVEIFTEDAFGARNPGEAMRIMKELRAAYPDSALMHSSELVALYSARRFEEVLAGGDAYVGFVDAKKYNPIEAAKGHVIRGTALWAMGRRNDALDAFRLAAEVRLNGKLSRWAVWARIRSGQVNDELGRREDALRDYRSAADEPDTWQFRRLAQAGLKKPFKADYPGAITPP